MILKPYEPDDAVARLERKLAASRSHERSEIEREIRIRRAGAKGEREASYFLDFDFGASSNHAVIHNLRLEYEGFTAQIDHLLINRFYGLTVLETKYFSGGLKIEEDGSFHRYDEYDRCYVPIPSPVAQVERHVTLLSRLLRLTNQHLRRWGLGPRMEPIIESYVLVHTGSKIVRPAGFDTSRIMSSDRFAEHFNKRLDQKYGGIKSLLSLLLLFRILSRRRMLSFGMSLVEQHKPLRPLVEIPVVSAKMPQPIATITGSNSSTVSKR
jgi:hypothetical protein